MAVSDNVADAVLAALGPMTAMKLEKLVYYAQAWHLAWHREPLFDDEIEAWKEGPVVRHLYEQHAKQYDLHEWRSGNRPTDAGATEYGSVGGWAIRRLYGRSTLSHDSQGRPLARRSSGII